MTLESEIEDALVSGIERRGGLCLKLVLFNLMGWPDRTIFLNGKVYLVELKRPKKQGGRLSAPQAYWGRALKKCGFKIKVLWSVEEVNRFLGGLY